MDKVVSNVAFQFNLRRYTEASVAPPHAAAAGADAARETAFDFLGGGDHPVMADDGMIKSLKPAPKPAALFLGAPAFGDGPLVGRCTWIRVKTHIARDVLRAGLKAVLKGTC
jgi:hypothetical protein